MADNLLYFPYINLPNTDWTIRTLLYYDKIGSIVPRDFFYEPEKKYDEFMLSLVKQELVIPLDPAEQLDHLWQLNKPFLDFIQTKGFRIEAKQDLFLRGENEFINRQKFRSQKIKINNQKFDGELLYALAQLGLAKKEIDTNWYEVEGTTANYLMTYLASILANKLKMLPVTDKLNSISNVRVWATRTNSKTNIIRDKVLTEIIPLPTEINLLKLRKFKDDNLDKLNRFKNLIEQIALNPVYNDETLLTLKIEELKFEKEALTARMNERKLGDIFFGSACGVAGAMIGLAQAGTTGVGLGMPGFANAIYGALKIESPENIPDQTGLKYLSLIDKRLRYKKTDKQYAIFT